MNREQWLTSLTDAMRGLFEEQSQHVPEKIRLTCGWPSKGGMKSKGRVVGECFPMQASKDGSVEIFISPVLADSGKVAECLAHELVHACGAKGHKGAFRKIAEGIGLQAPMTSTTASPQLLERLNGLYAPLGAYPHAVLDRTLAPVKKDRTRLLKVVCDDCGYTIRVTRKWLEVGLPVCPCGQTMAECQGGE